MKSFLKLMALFNLAISMPLVFTINIYKTVFSPFIRAKCRFHPTCSSYALQALKEKDVFTALGLIAVRLLKCHPFHKGGFDPIK